MTDIIDKTIDRVVGIIVLIVTLLMCGYLIWHRIYVPKIEPWVNNIAIPTIENILYGIVMPIILIFAFFVVVVSFANWYSDNNI